ncbi:MAG TPA: spermidine/putrescine ABC transporter substrate-binding protein [Streptosporangiaceae bacterium]
MGESDGLHGKAVTRRQALAWGAAGAVATAPLSGALAACGSSSKPSAADQLSGTLILLGYPGWYGPDEFTEFHHLHPRLTVRNSASGLVGDAQHIAQIAGNRGKFDLTLCGPPVARQLQLAGFLQPLDRSAVPNLKNVAPVFQRQFPYGIPTDYGKTGIAYRKDLIPERPTSWHDLWQLAKKYSGKTTMLNYDIDIQGSVLRYLGYSVNSTNPDELNKMQQALLELKPHLQAVLSTDYSKPLIEGTAYMAIDYDYDIAAAQQKNKNIVWVLPDEGASAYIEGWVALRSASHLAAVWELMNFHLEPRNYASFINYTGAAYVEPAAKADLKHYIVVNQSLRYDAAALRKVEFEKYLGAKGVAERGKLWEEFLAA